MAPQLKLPVTFIIFALAFQCEIQSTFAKDVIYDFHAYYFNASVDGVKKLVLGVNGQFPGPTIRARLHDTLIVRVTNSIKDGDGEEYPTSVHWHGLEQFMYPWFDGPEGVTQCPIPYGQSMEYRFPLVQSGTYWYHSHHSWQYVEGFWGVLIIDNEAEVHVYDEETTITLMDWHHTHAKLLAEKYHNVFPHTTPVPDTGLINGRGTYPCEVASYEWLTCDPSLQAPALVSVLPKKTYRIRVINTSARSNFNFSIDGHKLTAIEVDGVDTVAVGPFDFVTVWPAQRYSLLITMSGDLNEYWIRANMTSLNSTVEQPKAILAYNMEFCEKLTVRAAGMGTGVQGRPATRNVEWELQSLKKRRQQGYILSDYVFPVTVPPMDLTKARLLDERHRLALQNVQLPTTMPNPNPVQLDPNLCRPTHGMLSAFDSYDIQFVLNATFDSTTGNIFGRMNGIAYNVSQPPVIMRMVKGLPLNESTNPQRIPYLNQTVQLVINNQNGGPHPWHLHGHTFWVLGTGEGNYTESEDKGKLNLHGVRRDTTETPPRSWVVIRFQAYNPGAWLLHCHINWHLEIGLGAVFIEAENDFRANLPIPDEAKRICGLNKVHV